MYSIQPKNYIYSISTIFSNILIEPSAGLLALSNLRNSRSNTHHWLTHLLNPPIDFVGYCTFENRPFWSSLGFDCFAISFASFRTDAYGYISVADNTS